MVKAIIFDLQGTLVENGIYPSPLKQARYFFRYKASYHEFVPKFESSFMIGKHDSLKSAFIKTAEDFKINLPDFAVDKLVGIWNKNKLFAKIFPDTIECLETLKPKYKLILVANCDCFTKEIISKFGLEKYFDEIMLSCDSGLLKENPEAFRMPLKRLGIKEEDAVMVGDSVDSDMNYANAAGIRGILIDRNDNRDYDEKVLTLADLQKLL